MRYFSNYIILFIALLLFISCEKSNSELEKDLMFPIGRTFLNTSSIEIKIGDKTFTPNFYYDSCGGYWINISKFQNIFNQNVKIIITRKNNELSYFFESSFNEAWLNNSFYIDCNNETIVSKSNELTRAFSSNIEKAKAIQQFVINNVQMKIYKDAFLTKASETYKLGYGTCMNFSRLYVALCRAAKIPARTIWGVVYGYNNDNIYDYHHQWAEIRDDSGYWHPADFNYTTNFNLNDIRYLDLIYSAEENTIIKDRRAYKIVFEDLKYYNDYPVTLTANLGFRLKSDSRPDSMVVEYSFWPK